MDLHSSLVGKDIEQRSTATLAAYLQQTKELSNGLLQSRTRNSNFALEPSGSRSRYPNLAVPAEASGDLLPIRLDLETDGYKLRDAFLWNTSGPMTPEAMGQVTCADFDFPTSLFSPLIAKAIRDACAEWSEYTAMVRAVGGAEHFNGITGIIRLDMIVGLLQVQDRLEWDLGSGTKMEPESFARHYAYELALPQEFIPIIAFDIREQVYNLRRGLLVTGFQRDTQTGQVRTHDPDLAALLAPLPGKRDPTRMADFTPKIIELTAADYERIEISRDREARRKRRQNRTSRRDLIGGLLRSPPRSMPTALSYRGSLHRAVIENDDEVEAAPKSRRKRK